jgi:hypothetical protein
MWAHEQIKRLVHANIKLIGWSLDLSHQADSLLTCERVQDTFSTRVFMRSDTRDVIATAFVAFSAGHKGAENNFTKSFVEDGVVIRLAGDTLETLMKKLANGEDFALENEAETLEVKWMHEDSITAYGSINSPIDGTDLRVSINFNRFN